MQDPPPVAQAAKGGAKSKRNFALTMENRKAFFRYGMLETFRIELFRIKMKLVQSSSLALREGYDHVKEGHQLLKN